MKNADKLFEEEFKQTISRLRNTEDITHVESPFGKFNPPLGKLYEVRGIPEDHIFSVLNGTLVRSTGGYRPEVYVLGAGKLPKEDINGNKIVKSASAPQGSLFVRSATKITIPYSFKRGEGGMDFANYWAKAPDGYRYIWAIPKEYLYRVSETALSVSTKQMKAYKGYSIKTWEYGTINVCVIPYNPNAKYTATRLLAVKDSVDFEEEIVEYVNTLIEWGIIPNIPDFLVEGGSRNLVSQAMPATYMGFERVAEHPESETNAVLELSEEE